MKNDPEKAFCKICCTQIRARKADLINHSNTAKHLNSIKVVRIHSQGSINFKPISLKSHHTQAAIALFVSTHSAILSMDHLGKLCNNNFLENYFNPTLHDIFFFAKNIICYLIIFNNYRKNYKKKKKLFPR